MTEQTRLERGQKRLQEVDANAATSVMTALADIAPDVATYIEEFAFGDIYSRPGLSLKQRNSLPSPVS